MSEEKYIDKDIVDLPKGYEDTRGIIQPLCDLNMKSASLIISKKIALFFFSSTKKFLIDLFK